MTPERPERSRMRLLLTGRPQPRFVPPPTISSGCSAASASRTAARTSSALVGENVSLTSASEPRQIGEARLAAVDVDAPQLGAAVQRREDLARVEQRIGVEHALHPLLLGQIRLVEHCRHEIALLDADPMLAGEHAAYLDAKLQDVRAERLRAFELAGIVRVVEDERVQIAVAGVEDVGD